jgi:putative tryptophan/tyrosine transport system substrate-binding protein
MDRRRFLVTSLAWAFAPALVSEAQPTERIYRIGYLALNFPPNPFYEAFILGLRELGYAESQNTVIESRWAEGKSERLPALAAELVRLGPDVLVTAAQAATASAKQATATIPIVMVNVTDPVGQGFISSFARPGGNITGLTYKADDEQMGKLLQLIKEAAPRLSRAAVLANAALPYFGPQKQVMEDVARILGIDLQWVLVQGPNEFEKAFAAMVEKRAGGVVVIGGPSNLLSSKTGRCAREKEPDASNVYGQGLCRGRWPDVLRPRHEGDVPSCGGLR